MKRIPLLFLRQNGIRKVQLLNLTDECKAAVATAVALSNRKSEIEHGFQLERMGYLDDAKEISYELHCYGCFVTNKAVKVDFNFSDGGRCDGIDPWFSFDFLDSNKTV